VDGCSRSLVTKRAIRDYVVDNRASGFSASEFLTRDLVNYNAGNTHDYHVMTLKRYSSRPQNLIVYGQLCQLDLLYWLGYDYCI